MSYWAAQSQQRPIFTSLVKELFDLLDYDSNYLKLHGSITINLTLEFRKHRYGVCSYTLLLSLFAVP